MAPQGDEGLQVGATFFIYFLNILNIPDLDLAIFRNRRQQLHG